MNATSPPPTDREPHLDALRVRYSPASRFQSRLRTRTQESSPLSSHRGHGDPVPAARPSAPPRS